MNFAWQYEGCEEFQNWSEYLVSFTKQKYNGSSFNRTPIYQVSIIQTLWTEIPFKYPWRLKTIRASKFLGDFGRTGNLHAGTELRWKNLVASRASNFKKLLALAKIHWPSITDIKSLSIVELHLCTREKLTIWVTTELDLNWKSWSIIELQLRIMISQG